MAFLPRHRASHWRNVLLVCLTLVIPTPRALAQSLQEQFLSDAQDGQLDQFDFISAALIASGVHRACELDGWRLRYEDLRAQIADDRMGGLAAIHAAVHERLLRGNYRSSATDLRIVLSSGDFNCLSALAIYLNLSRRAGHDLEIWLLPGHVCLKSKDPSGGVIEPGTLEWNDVVAHRPLPELQRRITPVELLGKFYYNRGVQLLEGRQYAAGLALLEISLQLDPADSDARANLAAGLNNWAVEQCRAQRYQQAAELIQQGLSVAPAFAPLVANERLVRSKLGR